MEDKKEVIHGFKGFNKDMTCRGFKYEVGKEYETVTCEPCESGFHACENPLDVFNYYPPSESVFCRTEQFGTVKTHNQDSKIASTKIKIGLQLSILDYCKAAFEFLLSKCEKAKLSHTTGYRSASSATGYRSASISIGDYSKSEITKTETYKSIESVACGLGYKNMARACIGSWIVLAELNEKYQILCIKSAKVDGKKIKADTWYKIENGRFKIVE